MTSFWAPAVALLCSFLLTHAVGALDQVPSAPEQASRLVLLDSEQCDVVSHDELRELVALELAPRAVRSPDQALGEAALTHAQVTCSDAQAQLFVRDAAHGREQELTLDLTEIAVAARARLLALALSELIATVDMEHAPQPTAPHEDLPVAEQTETPRHRPSQLWLGVGLAREGTPRMLAPSLQTGLAAAITSWPLALQSELQLHRGERAVSAGDVVSWTASGSAGMAGQLQTAWVDLSLGLGVRLGYAHLRGDTGADGSVMGQAVSGLWWGPTALVSAVLTRSTSWSVRAGFDLSYVARDVRGLDGSGRGAYSLEGLLLHANLGVIINLPKLHSSHE